MLNESNPITDKTEIEKFDKIAGDWWRETEGNFKILHQITPLRVKYISDKLTEREGGVSGLKILDLGCGGGIVSEALSKLGAKVTGIDASAKAIAAAKAKAALDGTDVEYLNVPSDEIKTLFDAVICLEVIEHTNRPERLVAEISRLTKPGGTVIISTIDRKIKSYLLSIIAAERILKIVPKNTHDYSKYIRPAELSSMCASTGLELHELKGLNFSINPYGGNFVSWSLSDEIEVNYFALFIKP